RRRVREIARRLRYVPNVAARSLITSRTGTLGVLLPDLYGEFFSEVIRGIDQAAHRSGYHLLVSSSHSDQAEIEAALRAMRGRVDGVLVMSPGVGGRALAAHLPDRQPVVLLNCQAREAGVDSITIDNLGGAAAMVGHLVRRGHRRIALVGGPARNGDARERRRGYRAALRVAGIERDPRLELPGDFLEASGYEAARRLLALRPRPTAVFAANDAMAIGALSALHEGGARVPEDVAVAGFDDIPIARYVNPPLSSVHVPIGELGARAMATLLRALADPGGHVRRQDVLATTLVIRQSCGGRGHAYERPAVLASSPLPQEIRS
ncbi:MAG TPA: LacI family DNA-binding transcriptional regulator, partial [Gemmatimonadaceae bacterium]|nr:LacI family DNA-binding transcriptional regulator [Gemmatimonadaceae bacterium]